MNIAPPATLTIDGVEHPIAEFSETIQRLVTIHTNWRNDLQEERLAVAKTEAAIRSLEAELNQTIATEMAAKAAAESGETESAEAVSTEAQAS